jgi:hypothetical protein
MQYAMLHTCTIVSSADMTTTNESLQLSCMIQHAETKTHLWTVWPLQIESKESTDRENNKREANPSDQSEL